VIEILKKSRLGKVVTFKVSRSFLQKLDSYAKKNGMRRNKVIKKALEEFLEEEMKKETVRVAKVYKIRL
jgi:metal-responsive CopG/Arc/MetJ family transcriptional regulator